MPTLFKWTHYFEVFACFKSLVPYNIANVLSITSLVSSSFKRHCLLVVWSPSHPPVPKPQHPCNMIYKIKRLKRKNDTYRTFGNTSRNLDVILGRPNNFVIISPSYLKKNSIVPLDFLKVFSDYFYGGKRNTKNSCEKKKTTHVNYFLC